MKQLSVLGYLVLLLMLLLSSMAADASNNAADASTPNASKKSKDTAKKALPQKQDLQPFNAISLSGLGDLYITQSDEQSLTVEAEDSLLPLIQVSVRDKTLYLNLKDASHHTQAKISYYLNIKEVQSIRSSSSSTIVIQDGLETNVLNLALSNFGQANLKIRVKKLAAKIDGGAKLEIQGTADEQIIQIIGAGEFDGTKLAGTKGVIDVSGNGVVSTRVSDSIAASISGQGTLQYCGKPVLTQQVSEGAIVRPLEANVCN